MADYDLERIVDLKRRISEWDAEHEHEIQLHRNANQGLRQALSLSLRLSLLGAIPSIIWILCWVAVTSVNETTVFQAVQSAGAFAFFGVGLAAAARLSGLAAHFWFRRSLISERLATIVITVLANALLFGWVVALFRW